MNRLKERLGRDEACLGLLVTMPSVPLVQVAAQSGLDWLFIDMEHGPIGIESAHAMVAATQGTDCVPVIRTPHAETWLSQPALDSGAFGIVHPMINDRAMAEAAVRSQKYPPEGARGVGPFYAAARFGLALPDYLAVANESVLCVVQIEHIDAVAAIDEILAVPGIDVAFIAPFDLSMSLGVPGQRDHPDMVTAVQRAEERICAAGLAMGGLAGSPEQAKAMIERGYRLILVAVDVGLIQAGLTAALEEIRR
ncbi:MAG: 2,4-dihydroxyhept-2-ene-1,7-dioic acid aldolase [Rhodospirillaceae bacterium]|nr:2,4-dihydroxyhept-2-ene-1,7-dioic acid aldolase [Rhodospirillaceae bacterium]MBT6117769.1 2,4-dihydroxyhept-2-ene-1,7-dioic acid aldolase [Rhodospirillaceae bacterium]